MLIFRNETGINYLESSHWFRWFRFFPLNNYFHGSKNIQPSYRYNIFLRGICIQSEHEKEKKHEIKQSCKKWQFGKKNGIKKKEEKRICMRRDREHTCVTKEKLLDCAKWDCLAMNFTRIAQITFLTQRMLCSLCDFICLVSLCLYFLSFFLFFYF